MLPEVGSTRLLLRLCAPGTCHYFGLICFSIYNFACFLHSACTLCKHAELWLPKIHTHKYIYTHTLSQTVLKPKFDSFCIIHAALYTDCNNNLTNDNINNNNNNDNNEMLD